jgi:hypothetical protein
MKAFKTFGLCLITTALISGSSCSVSSANRPPIDKVVTVTNCQPDQDPVEVARKDTVKWDFGPPSAHTYEVHFKTRTPFSTKDPPIAQKNPVKGDFWCTASFGTKCYYEYVITKDGGKLCADPGVHVGPGG